MGGSNIFSFLSIFTKIHVILSVYCCAIIIIV